MEQMEEAFDYIERYKLHSYRILRTGSIRCAGLSYRGNQYWIKNIAKELFDRKEGIVFPGLPHGTMYEIGIARAMHKNSESILWFSNGVDIDTVKKSFPPNIEKVYPYNLDSLPDLESQADKIMSMLHEKMKRNFSYLGDSYMEPVSNILIQKRYRPNLANLITRKNTFEIDFLGSYNSLLDAYFVKEYSLFDDEAIQYNIDCRIQYFIDRAVLFVYLRNHDLWVRSVDKLSEVVEQNASMNPCYFQEKYAIEMLKNVMRYHGMVTQGGVNLKELYNKFEKYSESGVLANGNGMVSCLCFDYKGLCAHKMALGELGRVTGERKFNVLSKEVIETLRHSGPSAEKNKAREFLKTALQSFETVLRISNECSMEDGYIWEGLALYNKARCEFLLHVLLPDGGYEWEETMELAIGARREAADKYEIIRPFPAVISHNLHAEYYHACLERLFYKIMEGSDQFDSSEFKDLKEKIRQWEKRSSFYADVLQVTKKLNQLEAVFE